VGADVPSVSVLLPVRDGATHLTECLDSLAAQTFEDFEVLAVDDGSRDATPRLLADRAARDPRIRVLRQDPLGVVPALEAARAAARGPLLARMDADDVALPGRLERQVVAMEANPSWGLSGCGVRYVPRSAVRDGARRYEAWLNGLTTPADLERDLFVECPLAHPTFVMRADVLERVGGYRDRGWPEDYDLVLRVAAAGPRLGTVPDVLLHWREAPGRLSRTHPTYTLGAFQRCKAHHLPHLHPRARDGVVVWGAGPVGKGFSRALAAEGMKVVAFVDLDPRKIGQSIHDAPVLAPHELDRVGDAFVVAAVGQAGARADIRAALGAAGRKEGVDFVAVA
jgi:hypothetical protein